MLARDPLRARPSSSGITQSELQLCAGPATFSGRSPPLLPSVRPTLATIWANPRQSALPTLTKTYGPQRQKMALGRSPPPGGWRGHRRGPRPSRASRSCALGRGATSASQAARAARGSSRPARRAKSERGNGGGERNADEPDEHTCDSVEDGSWAGRQRVVGGLLTRRKRKKTNFEQMSRTGRGWVVSESLWGEAGAPGGTVRRAAVRKRGPGAHTRSYHQLPE